MRNGNPTRFIGGGRYWWEEEEVIQDIELVTIDLLTDSTATVRRYYIDLGGSESVSDLVAVADDEIYLLANTTGVDSLRYGPCILKCDSRGHVFDGFKPFTFSPLYGQHISAPHLEQLSTGDLVFPTSLTGQGANEGKVIRITTDGEEVWASPLPYLARAVCEDLGSDRLLAAGYIPNVDTLFVTQLAIESGEILWTGRFPMSEPQVIDVHQVQNGAYLLGGLNGEYPGLSFILMLDDTPATSGDESVARTFTLRPVYPNPFNSTATVSFDLAQPASLNLTVFDLLGREVTVLSDVQPYAPGTHRVVWDASGLPGGTYFLRARTEDEQQMRRMLFLK